MIHVKELKNNICLASAIQQNKSSNIFNNMFKYLQKQLMLKTTIVVATVAVAVGKQQGQGRGKKEAKNKKRGL